MEYIDVRGPHPIYVNGARAYKLEGQDRSLTIERARELAQTIEDEQEKARPKLERTRD